MMVWCVCVCGGDGMDRIEEEGSSSSQAGVQRSNLSTGTITQGIEPACSVCLQG